MKEKKVRYNYKEDVKKFEKKHGKVKYTKKLLTQYTHCKKIDNRVEMTPLEYAQYLKDDMDSTKQVMMLLGSKRIKKRKENNKFFKMLKEKQSLEVL